MEWILSNIPLTCTFIGIIGILYSLIVAGAIKGAPTGDAKMGEIASAIQEGSIAYLNRQLKSMVIVGIVIFVIIFFGLGAKTAIGFLVGAVASFLAGYIGMRVSVLANVRVAEACKKGLASGLSLAFKGGSVTGMLVAGLALTAIAGFFTYMTASMPADTALVDLVVPLVALGFGGSWSPSLPVSAAVSSPRALMLALTWWVRSKPAFRKTTRGTQRPSLTMWATTWVTVPVWPLTFLKHTR